MDYVASNGSNPVQEWYRTKLSIQQATDLEEVIGILGKSKHWGMPDFRWLPKGLGEVRLKARPPIRLVGCAGKLIGQFVFLIGCTHKETRYDPTNALDTASKRKRDLEQNRGSVIDHVYDGNESTEEGQTT